MLPGEVLPSGDGSPLSWATMGNISGYNLICKPNSFIQIWKRLNSATTELDHCVTLYINNYNNIVSVVGIPNDKEANISSLGPISSNITSTVMHPGTHPVVSSSTMSTNMGAMDQVLLQQQQSATQQSVGVASNTLPSSITVEVPVRHNSGRRSTRASSKRYEAVSPATSSGSAGKVLPILTEAQYAGNYKVTIK